MISAEIIADSISPNGVRIVTMKLVYPRFIHGEVMTHRQFSRNASSSRAIPVGRMIDNVLKEPAMPIHWGSNKPGMQAGEEIDELVDLSGLSEDSLRSAGDAWMFASAMSCEIAQRFVDAGFHKQIVNRLTEPFQHMTTLVTSTKWSNFFSLRDHKDAQPEIRELAKRMREAMDASEPNPIGFEEWHLPFIEDEELEELGQSGALKISTARCARISYLGFDGKKTSFTADFDLYRKLILAEPAHASPAEHQATPGRISERFMKYIKDDGFDELTDFRDCLEAAVRIHGEKSRWKLRNNPWILWKDTDLMGNFHGWIQHRKTIRNESCEED